MYATPRAQRISCRIHRLFVRQFRKVPRLEDLDEPHLLPLVTIVGRPNVGKSALFNRLVRKRDALVYDTPGDHVTRDYREGLGQIGDLQFRLIDTSGLEPTAPPSSLQGRAAALTCGVLRSSHAVLMLLDARQGLVTADEALLSWLRRNNKAPLLLLANKADTSAGQNNLDALQADLAGLGCDTATPISATSGEGMADLYQLLQPTVDEAVEQLKQQQWKQRSSSGSSANDKRQYVRLGYRFSADSILHEQRQQADETQVIGTDSSSSNAEEDEQHGDATLVAAAAAEEAEVDRLIQQQLDAETEHDSDSSNNSTEAVDEATADEAPADADADGCRPQGPLRLAILGLPNAGKSTLMNTLLGYERSLTGPEPGLTRDPTAGWLAHAGLQLQLIDTAGWKRAGALHPTQAPTANSQHSKIAAAAAAGTGDDDPSTSTSRSSSSKKGAVTSKVLADASLAQAKRALSAVHVAVLLLDAPRLLAISQAITRLELQLAGLALSQGKALVVGLNKADAVPGGPAAVEKLRERVAELLEQKFLAAGRLPVVALSALQGDGAQQVLDAVVEAYGKWNKRVSAYKLRASLAKHALRFFGTGGTANLLGRIKWATQLKPRPPTFVLLLRGSSEVDEGGQRFLANVLRQSLGMQGVPLRLYVRYNKKAQHHQQQQRLQHRNRHRRARR